MAALLLTILVGSFFLVGNLISKFFPDKNKLMKLSTGITFIIMLYLIIFDLFPEIYEIFNPFQEPKYFLLIIIFAILGFAILKLLDFFIPEHTHHHQEGDDHLKEHSDHLFHIGLLTSVSLLIHNLLEGISIYVTALNNFKSGVIMAITVGLHNIPLGTEIMVSINSTHEKTFLKKCIYFLLPISSFLGAFILYLLHIELGVMVEGCLLSLTLGMLVYICFCELWQEVRENSKTKEMKVGIIIGVLLSIILFLL